MPVNNIEEFQMIYSFYFIVLDNKFFISFL